MLTRPSRVRCNSASCRRNTDPCLSDAARPTRESGIPLYSGRPLRGRRTFAFTPSSVFALAASIFTGAIVATLIAAFVMPWLLRGETVRFPWDVVTSVAVGIAVGIADTRARGVRQFLTALAPAALGVPALFLWSPNVQRHLQLACRYRPLACGRI